ncbi:MULTISPECIES: hypothetical protein [unclassified Bosea (in: a-proteobacteria)]|uniref:hypothetical protein n=1 Tax=unclassified Bosea (in: a-proteobacteria) TaxID=2653178 RepID=UPI000F7F8DF8|nr:MULTISPECIES: hypothetical protein [unclassified Bosea (in: a-proteobacteria)]
MLRRQFLALLGAAPAAAVIPTVAAAKSSELTAIDADLGSIVAGSINIGSRLVIGADGTMRVFDANGVLRVCMGRW